MNGAMTSEKVDELDMNHEGEGEGPVQVLTATLRGYVSKLVRSEYGDGEATWYTAGGLAEREQQIAETAFQMGLEHAENGRRDDSYAHGVLDAVLVAFGNRNRGEEQNNGR